MTHEDMVHALERIATTYRRLPARSRKRDRTPFDVEADRREEALAMFPVRVP